LRNDHFQVYFRIEMRSSRGGLANNYREGGGNGITWWGY